MPVRPKQNRRRWWVAGIIAVVFGSALSLWWWGNRRVGGPLSEGLSAYARGDWNQSALLRGDD